MSEGGKRTAGGCLDLNDLYGSKGVADGFGKILMGKRYKPEEEKKTCKCGYILKGSEKFCPQCGERLI